MRFGWGKRLFSQLRHDGSFAGLCPPGLTYEKAYALHFLLESKKVSMPPQTSKTPRAGLHRVFYAARYSGQGLTGAYKNERAFKEETWLAAVLVQMAFLLAIRG